MKSLAKVPGILTLVTGASDVATRVSFPNHSRKVSVYFETDPGKVAYEGADAAPIHANYAPIVAGSWFRFDIDPDQHAGGRAPVVIHVATVAGGTTVRIWGETG